jgi:hypothetical protein
LAGSFNVRGLYRVTCKGGIKPGLAVQPIEIGMTKSPIVLLIPAILLCGLLMGCDPNSASGIGANSPTTTEKIFDVGLPSQFRLKRVYKKYAVSHGVYLVSNHGMLVALAAECTNDDHAPSVVRFDDVSGIYRCPACGAKYTRDGLNIGDSKTTRPLERCRIRHTGPIYDPDTTIMIDPGKRFRQEENEWSKHTSYFLLDEAKSQQDAARLERARTQELAPLAR